MSETTPDYVDLLRSFKYRRDIRDPNPESSHLQAFRTGWNRGAGKKAYTTRVLETLTWQNLGNRLGLKLGNASPEAQERALRILAKDMHAELHNLPPQTQD